MYKKLLISICLSIATILCFTVCLANDATNMVQDAANGVRNVVGGAENAVENAAGGLSNTAKNVTEGMENGANNITNDMRNTTNNMTSTTNTNNNGYTATRTSTDTGAATFMGMNATTWTWLIMGIAAIAIVALVWYYATSLRSSRYDDRD